MTTSYKVLGLEPSASKTQVKEAFRRLCQIYHPDKCAVSMKPIAEAKFKSIKDAYDSILKGQAGYAPPPPGTQASQRYTSAYYQAQGTERGGPIKTGGPFGGFGTERDFYRSMLRSNRNNPLMIILVGVVAIPTISMITGILNGNMAFITRFKNEGIHMFTPGRFRVNGHDTLANPFSIRSLDHMEDSYMYKSEKYAHLRPKPEDEAPAH